MSMDEEVERASEDDLRAAARNALVHAGCTREELIEQHRQNDFVSLRARLAWVAVGDLLENPCFTF